MGGMGPMGRGGARRRTRRRMTRMNASANEAAYEKGKAEGVATQEAPAESSGDDVYAQLEKLGELHKNGVLTDEEFAAKKQALLNK